MIVARYSNIWKVIFISLIFFGYQSMANSVVGIMSQITYQNNIKWAGPTTTIMLFFFSGIGSLYNSYLKKYKYKYTFYLGSFGYLIYVASAIVFVSISKDKSILIFVGTSLINIIGGMIASMLYNSQWNYISECSTIDNASMYFGINLGVVQASNLFGNLLSSYIVQPLGQKNYCIMMAFMIGIVSLLFLLVKQVNSRNQQQVIPETAVNASLIQNQQQQVPSRTQLYKLIPSFYFSGTIIAFVYTFISVLMYNTFSEDLTPTQLNTLTFRILMLQGVGQFLGGLYYIRYSDKWQKKTTLLISNKLFVLTVAFVMVSYFFHNIYLLGVGVIILGFVDCSSFSLNLAIVSQQRWDSFAYSLFNLGQCMGVVISIIILMWSSIQVYILYAFGTQIVSSIFLHNFKPRTKKNIGHLD